MNKRMVTLGLIWIAASAPLRAQDGGLPPEPPEAAVDLHEGILLYLQAQNPDELSQAVDRFTAVLSAVPQHRAALLFRALAHGESGLLQRGRRLVAEDRIRQIDQILEIRLDPTQRQQIEAAIAALEQRLADDALEPAERLVAQTELNQRQGFLQDLEDQAPISDDELRSERSGNVTQLRTATAAERVSYGRMVADLSVLIRLLDRPETVVRLLDVIAQSKIARLDEDEAVRVQRGEITAKEASGAVRQLRANAARTLEQTAAALESLLREGIAVAEDRVRTQFFLGVIRYRQGIPRRADQESPDTDYARLGEAERIMANIAGDAAVDDSWRSYASLYLGLIIPFRAGTEPDAAARAAILDEADRRLTEAARLDTRLPTEPDGEPTSASRAIPTLVARQREQIQALRVAPVSVAPRRRNDIQISTSMGLHRDTNVVLLGERTDLPRDVSKKRDFALSAGLFVDYTLDLDDKWTLGLQVRTTQLWHCDIDEFDEQRYGASAALQYEIMPQRDRFGPIHLRLQYDYDYTLLGRQGFLSAQTISPNLRFFWHDRRAETNLYVSYGLRNYFEPLYDRRFDRDGEYISMGIVQSYKLYDMTEHYRSRGIEPWGGTHDDLLAQDDPDYPARYVTPYLGLEYAWDSTAGDEFDQNEYTLLTGVRVPLPYGFDLDASADFSWQHYRHGSLIDYHRRARRDFIQRYSLGVERTFVLRGGQAVNRYTPTIDRVLMTVRAHAAWTLDDSNVVDRLGQAIFEYDRVIYGLSVAFSFN